MASIFRPNPAAAVVDSAKVRDYLLSPTHPVGRFKAVVFEAVGYRRSTWMALQTDLRRIAWLAASGSIPTPFGQRYRVHAILRGPSGRNLAVTVVWLVRSGEQFPRLVTAMPRRRP
jgi:hypothetical protein